MIDIEKLKKERDELEEKISDIYAEASDKAHDLTKKLEKVVQKIQKSCPHPLEHTHIVGEYTLEYKTCFLCGKTSYNDDWS